ncbi:MAG: peptidyl-prolyl cis-trans isomerase [Candidatus Aminicenantales bacterium]
MKKARESKNLLFYTFLIFTLFFTACREKGEGNFPDDYVLQEFQTEGNVVLRVEGTKYYASDFENYLRNIVGSASRELGEESLSRLFDKYVDEKLLLQGARNMGIFLTSEEERDYLASLRNQFWQENRDMTDFDTQSLFDKLMVEKYSSQLVKNIKIEDEEISDYYDAHKKDFLQSERVKVSQILLSTEDKAVEILGRLKGKSEDEFRKVAREESIGPEAGKGGEMGWFEMGQLPYEMEKVVFSLGEGELSQVVESPYGFHIFRLDRRSGLELIPLERAAPEIKLRLIEQKIREKITQHIGELKKTLNWEIMPQNLSFNYKRKAS